MLVLCSCTSTPRFTEHGERSNDKIPQRSEQPTRDEKPSRQSTGKVLLTLEGIASYYAHDFHGKQTSNGETYDMNSLTAAHRTFPFGTKVRVTNLENHKTVIVRVNDRGPFKGTGGNLLLRVNDLLKIEEKPAINAGQSI